MLAVLVFAKKKFSIKWAIQGSSVCTKSKTCFLQINQFWGNWYSNRFILSISEALTHFFLCQIRKMYIGLGRPFLSGLRLHAGRTLLSNAMVTLSWMIATGTAKDYSVKTCQECVHHRALLYFPIPTHQIHP